MKGKMYRLFLGLCCLLLSASTTADVLDAFRQAKENPQALYVFLKNMPKGGELHYHFAGSVYPETMLAIAKNSTDHVFCLNTHSFTLSEKPEGCLSSERAVSALEQNVITYNKVLKAWSMKNFIPGPESAHDHFFNAFMKFYALILSDPVLLLADIMTRAAEQNEQYLEIMINSKNLPNISLLDSPIVSTQYDVFKNALINNAEFNQAIDKTANEMDRLVRDTKNALGCHEFPNLPVCSLEVKFQYYVLREQPLSHVFAETLFAFAIANRSSDVVGVNLVQPEDGFIALRDYSQQMRIFSYMRTLYPNVKLSLHAGELTEQIATPHDLTFHIFEAVTVAKADRIGHGVSIAREKNVSDLLDYMHQHQIPVEINLSSNQTLLEISLAEHPLRYYLEKGVPTVLSTDDEGILRTDLTSQYVKAVLEVGLDYPTLKQMSRNALTYSFLPGTSLWLDPFHVKKITECDNLLSSGCLKFVAHSQKAARQRELELAFIAFEKTFNASRS